MSLSKLCLAYQDQSAKPSLLKMDTSNPKATIVQQWYTGINMATHIGDLDGDGYIMIDETYTMPSTWIAKHNNSLRGGCSLMLSESRARTRRLLAALAEEWDLSSTSPIVIVPEFGIHDADEDLVEYCTSLAVQYGINFIFLSSTYKSGIFTIRPNITHELELKMKSIEMDAFNGFDVVAHPSLNTVDVVPHTEFDAATTHLINRQMQKYLGEEINERLIAQITHDIKRIITGEK